jgi:hypothetical protein
VRVAATNLPLPCRSSHFAVSAFCRCSACCPPGRTAARLPSVRGLAPSWPRSTAPPHDRLPCRHSIAYRTAPLRECRSALERAAALNRSAGQRGTGVREREERGGRSEMANARHVRSCGDGALAPDPSGNQSSLPNGVRVFYPPLCEHGRGCVRRKRFHVFYSLSSLITIPHKENVKLSR